MSSESMGEIIAAARRRLGLDQPTLAAQLGVTQQTVSRWERNQSLPARKLVSVLAAVLQVPETDLATQTIKRSPREASGEDPLPAVQSRLLHLPFGLLPDETFEVFVTELVSRTYGDQAFSTKLGSKGDKQNGLDVIVRFHDGSVWGIQCKRHKEFGPKKVRDAVSALTQPVDKAVIALSSRASAQASLEIVKHPSWELWDIDALSRMVRELNPDQRLDLVDHFFPGYRSAFLGVPLPGPWLTTDEFFAERVGALTGHRWTLVGRESQTTSIVNWVESQNPKVGVLVGRGGQGKSKLVHEVARQLEAEGTVTVRFLDRQVEPTPEQFELLPHSGRLLVIIDDVHEVRSLPSVLNGIWRQRPDANVLLACRQYGLPELERDLMSLGLPAEMFSLKDLSLWEATHLAAEVARRNVSDPVVRQLAALTSDCPFVTVVGAELLHRGKITSDTFAGAADVRKTVLQIFADHLTGDSNEAVSAVLAAIAAFQPVRLADNNFQVAVTNLAGLDSWDQVSHHIRELEDRGLILRRGQSVRVVPDLLGDIIFARAAFDERSKIPTGFLDRAREVSAQQCAEHLLVNASRIDWQLRDGEDIESYLIESLWSSFHERFFRSTDPANASRGLNVLRRIAFFQPSHALAVARDLVAAQEILPRAVRQAGRPPLPARVNPINELDEMTPVLANIGHNLEYLPECLDLLWQIAEQDVRQPHQHPRHALRIIEEEFAKFTLGKPFAYNLAVTDAVERWLKHPSGEELSSPLEVLNPMLATEAADQSATNNQITFRPYLVSPDQVRPVRDRVISICITQTGSDDLERAVSGMTVLASSISYPTGMFNRRAIAQDERPLWTPEFLSIIERIRQIGADPTHDPLIALVIRKYLPWHVAHSPELAEAAKEALADLPTSLEHRAVQCLHDGWGHMMRRQIEDHEAASAQLVKEFNQVAEELLATRTDQEVLQFLGDRLRLERRMIGAEGHPAPFIRAVLNRRISVALLVCEQLLHDPDSPLAPLLPEAVDALASTGHEQTVNQAQKLLALDSKATRQHVATALGWKRARGRGLLDGELALLEELAGDPDPGVRRAIAIAARALATDHPTSALDLLMKIRIDDFPQIAAEVLACLSDGGPLAWEAVPEADKTEILDRIVACPSIDEHEIMAFLSAVSRLDPHRVVDLLIQRAIREENLYREMIYQGIPLKWSPPMRIRETRGFPDCLRRVLTWMTDAAPDSEILRTGAQIYAAVAGTWDDQAFALLEEPQTTTSVERMTAVGHVLREMPGNVVFDQVQFVEHMFQHAQYLGEKTVKDMNAGFYFSVVSNTWNGSPSGLEQSERARAIAAGLPLGSAVRKFYDLLTESAKNGLNSDRVDEEEETDDRDW